MSRFRKFLVIGIALFFATLGFVYYKAVLDPENTKRVFYPMSAQEKGLLHEGDILIRRGYGFVSDKIVETQESPYPVSHCAMLVGEPGNWKVIHSLSSSVSPIDGAQEQSLQRFLNESVPNSIIVQRFKTSSDTISKIVNRVKYYSSIRKPFDHDFDRIDTTKFYCTELFQHCFQDILGKDIFQHHETTLTLGIYNLNAILDTSFFQTIINHHRIE
jgi:uncharacterized protein YycO